MKLQKQLSKRTAKKDYHRYIINISSDLVEEAGFKEGDELKGEARKGEIRLTK